MRPATALPPRQKLELQVWLDIPVGLTPLDATPDGPERAIVFTRDPGPDSSQPQTDGTQPGSLVLVRVRNQGPASVSSTDLTALLAFAFPGRQVLAAWPSAAPAAEKGRRTDSPSAAHAPLASGAASHRDGSEPDQVRLDGDFPLRAKDACTVAVILSGTPAADRPAHPDGMLAAARVISRSFR
jgi:hypothetical protein